ncbi:TPA: hypothetical protein JS389_000272 [Serratia marcescens]|nr:hypothetical protein [Serratia marcescens]
MKPSKSIIALREKIIHSNKFEPSKSELKHANEIEVLLDILNIVYIDIIPKSANTQTIDNITSVANTFSACVEAYESGNLKSIFKNLIFVEELIENIEHNFTNTPTKEIRDKLEFLYSASTKLTHNNYLTNNIIHFVWIGSITNERLKYLELWAECNKGFRIMFWIDPLTFLADTLLKEKKRVLQCEKDEGKALILQSECWLFSQKNTGTNDEKIVRYFNKNGTELDLEFYSHISDQALSDLSLRHTNIEVMDINVLIEKEEYCHENDIYNFEIFFRTNLAAASDVIRLLILYEFGGIYIDIDTLPKINKDLIGGDLPPAMSDTSCNEALEVMNNMRIVEKYWKQKSIAIKKLNKINTYPGTHSISDVISTNSKVISHEQFFDRLGKITTPFDLPLISRRHKEKNVFFSNVIIANSRSITIRLAMKIVKENYKELIRRIQFNHLNDFVISYAFDGYLNDSRITLNLSGPGVLLRAIFLSIIELLKLPENISENALLGFVNTHLSFVDHTMDTEMGLTSSWIKKKAES